MQICSRSAETEYKPPNITWQAGVDLIRSNVHFVGVIPASSLQLKLLLADVRMGH